MFKPVRTSKRESFYLNFIFIITLLLSSSCADNQGRIVNDFNKNWKFKLGDEKDAKLSAYDDADWRTLTLPHDWSIEGEFSEDHPAGIAGGALPTGIGWYRKTFTLPESSQQKKVYIDFDGVYRNSEVWINGNFLGRRPNGYISFRYDLTPYLHFGEQKNVIAVRVDNSAQPASRWYTGSGIYRNVRLVTTGLVHVDHWGTFITTPEISEKTARVNLAIQLRNASGEPASVQVLTRIFDAGGTEIVSKALEVSIPDSAESVIQDFDIENPELWTLESPSLYSAVTTVTVNDEEVDRYETPFGIREFRFDSEKGFFLNGKPLKILGACKHHDLGALGAAVNKRAIERQLEILRDMGVNAIRTAHNPPAPELLDLCDSMGFIVMDEAFDMWKKKKNAKDYHLFWDEWHEKDLGDLIRRDRNHPSVMIWSIGNEIREQFDSTGITMTRELVNIVKALDPTRPVTCALTENVPEKNFIYQSGALDLLGFNYKHDAYADFPETFPGEKYIATENMSALATRGHYDMPSDSIRRWPVAHNVPIVGSNPDYTVSAYDNVSAYWGSTHEETWSEIKDMDHMSGLFLWTGFDYLGEPTPYPWPARSSYFGVIDLAGFPKDTYYLYKSEWTDEPVLHVFPHWNWREGKTVDVWAYYNNADEVELFLNGESLGTRSKDEDDLHVMWRVKYQPGEITAVSRKNGKEVLSKTIRTAGKPAKIELVADRKELDADGSDLSFVTVRVTDSKGNLVPDASNMIRFEVTGEGFVAGVDNGYQASHEPFKANYRKAYNGLCLAIIQTSGKPGDILLKATSDELEPASITLKSR